jgi:hypothetical protein
VVAASTVRGGENGGLCGGLNDPRVVTKQAELDRLRKAPEQDRDPALIQAAEDALRAAIAAREKTRKGKSGGGKGGGANGRGKPRNGERQSHVLILRDEKLGETCYSVTNAPMAYHLQHKKHLFKEFNAPLVTNKMKELIDEIKLREGRTMELVVGTRGDEHVIKLFKGMKVKKGKTGLWLTVAEEVPKGIVQITHFPSFK